MGNGFFDPVFALTTSATRVYAGGGRTYSTGSSPAYGYVAEWDGTALTMTGVFNSAVMTLAQAPSGDVYAGGYFDRVGGGSANRVARWDGVRWVSLGAGVGTASTESVQSLIFMGTDLYVGGEFARAGGQSINNIARWDGSAWTRVGGGVDGPVHTLTTAGTKLYVGGRFAQAGGIAARNIARWEGGAWSTLGSGLNNVVFNTAVTPTGEVIAGGDFTTVGDGSKITAYFGIYDYRLVSVPAEVAGSAAPILAPNPATSTVYLTRAPAGLAVSLLDATGRLVGSSLTDARGTAMLHVLGLPVGLYIVRCGPLTRRLVVE